MSTQIIIGQFEYSVLLLYTAGDADPSISTSTPTPCYGDVVTLVCHHPEVASNPMRFSPALWRENGVGIFFGGVYLETDTSEDLTRTTLTINITVDYFRNTSFNYSCLVYSSDSYWLPTIEVDSGEVTVDPVGECVLVLYSVYILQDNDDNML